MCPVPSQHKDDVQAVLKEPMPCDRYCSDDFHPYPYCEATWREAEQRLQRAAAKLPPPEQMIVKVTAKLRHQKAVHDAIVERWAEIVALPQLFLGAAPPRQG